MSSRFFVGIGFIFLVYQGCQALRKPSFRFTHIKDVALVILLICLILSAFQKFPFGVPRLSLFYAPILLFMTVEAFQWIKERNKIVYSLIQYTFLIYLGYVSIGIAGVVFNMDLGAQSIIWQ